MDCPVCRRSLAEIELEDGLRGRECPGCGGRWISSVNYLDWLHRHGNELPTGAVDGVAAAEQATESRGAKICLECGAIMHPLRVGHGITFKIDRCGRCGGLWLDRNEWESLRARGLHDDLYLIYTDGWQKALRAQEAQEIGDVMLLERLGAADLERVKEIRACLDRHPEKRLLISLLLRNG